MTEVIFNTNHNARILPEPDEPEQHGLPRRTQGEATPFEVWVENRLAHEQYGMIQGVAQLVAHDRKEMRATVRRAADDLTAMVRRETTVLQQEIERERELNTKTVNLENERYELLQRELTVLKSEVAVERSLKTLQKEIADDALKDKLAALRQEASVQQQETAKGQELLQRELAILKAEIGVAAGLRALNEEIATARAEISNVTVIDERINEKAAAIETNQQKLARDFTKLKDRVGKMRVDQALVDHRLTKHLAEEAAPPPRTELEITSSSTHFIMRDISPEAAQALREFAVSVVNHDGLPVFALGPPLPPLQ